MSRNARRYFAMIRSTVFHELLAVLLLGACLVGGMTSTYPEEDRGTAAAAPQGAAGATPSPPPPTMLASFIEDDDPVRRRIFADYGAVFVAGNGAVPPPAVVFASAREVDEWQAGVPVRRERLGRFEVELQAPAMEALLAARAEARGSGRDVTARGADAARRSYADTVRLWRSRVEPALEHWVVRNRLEAAAAARIRQLSPFEQVPEVLGLEARGIYFSTDFSKSILYSVAAPGTSQHLSMLALDVSEFDDPAVRQTLARHGWFQTVATDLPHFTYLGVDEDRLPSLGLKRVVASGRPFWIPDLDRR
jgi:hypothetical protein